MAWVYQETNGPMAVVRVLIRLKDMREIGAPLVVHQTRMATSQDPQATITAAISRLLHPPNHTILNRIASNADRLGRETTDQSLILDFHPDLQHMDHTDHELQTN